MRRRVSRSSLHSVLRFGIGGDGFLDRIRALSFAMLGLTAAAALALVAFIANQGWPQVGSLLPVPAIHRADLSDNSVVALPAGRQPSGIVVTVPPATLAPPLSGGGLGGRQPSHQGSSGGSDAGPASNVVVLAPQGPESTPSSPGTGASPSQPVPAPVPSESPAAAPTEPTPTATPQPVATAPTTPVTPPPSTPTTTPTTPETPIPDEPTPDEPSEEGESEGGEETPSAPSEEPTEPEGTPEPPLPDEGETAPEAPEEVPGIDGGLEH
jgi:hypothetical protein